MPDAKTVVLGAGAAGLGAARALADAGHDVIVVEARSHIAGRAWTSHVWPDLPVDMGATWIHGVTGNPLTALAAELGLTLVSSGYDETLSLAAGGRIVDVEQAMSDAERIVARARAAVDDCDRDVSLKSAVTRAPDWAALPAVRRRLIRHLIHSGIEHEYSGDWSRQSAWYYDDDKDFPGGDAVLATGFAPLMTHLARGLDIRLDELALRLAPTPGGVKLTTTRATYAVNRVIVTVPLGVLKSGDIRFDAAFNKKRQRAIDRLEMGLLNKCWLRFERAFWPPEIDWISNLASGTDDDVGHWAEFASLLAPTAVPLLVGFNAAAPAETMEAHDDADTAASAMEALRTLFGSAIPDPVGAQVTRWRQDRFARGAYSFLPVGTKAKTRRQLFGSDWEGRLLFAGEATSAEYPGTLHGALMTGRAAAAIIAGG